MTDQLCVIVLAAADDRTLDLWPLSLGEIVGAQDDLYSFFNKPIESCPEGVMHPIAHEKDVHLMTASNCRLGQPSDRMRILVLGACTQKEAQLLGHLRPLLGSA